jgi:ArsR family transcriptional regulator
MTKLNGNRAYCGEAADVLKAIAHPLRLQIVAVLCEKEEHVNGLSERLGAPQSIVSQQLRILRMRGLVSPTRKNGHSVYRLMEPSLKKVVRCMELCLSKRERGGRQ